MIRITPKEFKQRRFKGKSKKRYLKKIPFFINLDSSIDIDNSLIDEFLKKTRRKHSLIFVSQNVDHVFTTSGGTVRPHIVSQSIENLKDLR